MKLQNLTLPPGDGYVWIAAEASIAKALRMYFLEARLQNARWMRAAGYWQRGEVATHENFE